MIDIKVARENPDLVRASQKSRGEDPSLVDQLLKLDETRRNAISNFEKIRAEQNNLSKKVGAAKGDEKQSLLDEAKNMALQVKSADQIRTTAEQEFKVTALKLSNIVDSAAPVGGEVDFKVIEEVGKPRDFNKEGFTPKDLIWKIAKENPVKKGITGAR